MTEPALELTSLHKRFGNSVVLDGVSLSVPAGQLVAILGRSGSGKSTLLRCASRLIEPDAGIVRVAGVDVTAARGRALSRARARVGFVFQQFNLIRSYTVRENVLLGRLAHRTWWEGTLGLFNHEDKTLALKCIEQVGLSGKEDALARELSGGQQQRVAIARTFAQQPRCIFADEPTASLDPKLAEVVMELLKNYGTREGVPVLVNVHTLDHARRFADRVIGLRRGKIMFDGPVAELTAEAVEGIYADLTDSEVA